MVPSLVDLCLTYICNVAIKEEEDHPYRYSIKLPIIVQEILFKYRTNRHQALQILIWLCSPSTGIENISREVLCLYPKRPLLVYLIDLLQDEHENSETICSLILLSFFTTPGHRYSRRVIGEIAKELPTIIKYIKAHPVPVFTLINNLLESERTRENVLKNTVQIAPHNLVYHSFTNLYDFAATSYNGEKQEVTTFSLNIRATLFFIRVLTYCSANPILREQIIQLSLNPKFSTILERTFFLPLEVYRGLAKINYYNDPRMDKYLDEMHYILAINELADELMADKRISTFLKENEEPFYKLNRKIKFKKVFDNIIAAILYPLVCCFLSETDE